MNVHFPPEFIEKIKYSIPILDLASEYFHLEKLNSKMYRAKCKHRGGDNTPSLTFYLETNTFYCWACHAGKRTSETEGSDIICFVRWMEGLDWQEAILHIAKLANIEVPKTNLTKEDIEKMEIFKNLLNENRVYWANLNVATKVKEYYYERGLLDEDINKFRLGAKWCKEVNDYRPVYPVIDEQGRTVAFTTRLGIEGTKYKNSTLSVVYKKKELLYGLSFIKKDIRIKDYVILVEGQNDVIQMQKYNMPACATMGTAISDEHIAILKRYTNNIIIFFDGDEAGEDNAKSNGIKLRESGFNVYCVIKDGLDPDDLCRKIKYDIEKFVDEHKEPILTFIINRVVHKSEKEISVIKMNAIAELNDIMSSISSSLDKDIFYEEAKQRLLKGVIVNDI